MSKWSRLLSSVILLSNTPSWLSSISKPKKCDDQDIIFIGLLTKKSKKNFKMCCVLFEQIKAWSSSSLTVGIYNNLCESRHKISLCVKELICRIIFITFYRLYFPEMCLSDVSRSVRWELCIPLWQQDLREAFEALDVCPFSLGYAL